jgi:hypothetical protein
MLKRKKLKQSKQSKRRGRTATKAEPVSHTSSEPSQIQPNSPTRRSYNPTDQKSEWSRRRTRNLCPSSRATGGRRLRLIRGKAVMKFLAATFEAKALRSPHSGKLGPAHPATLCPYGSQLGFDRQITTWFGRSGLPSRATLFHMHTSVPPDSNTTRSIAQFMRYMTLPCSASILQWSD